MKLVKVPESTPLVSSTQTSHSATAFGYFTYIDKPSKKDLKAVTKFYEPVLRYGNRAVYNPDKEMSL